MTEGGVKVDTNTDSDGRFHSNWLWAERALMDGELAEGDASTLSPVIARLGVADVRAFGLAWEDCEELLRKLGFSPRVEVVAV